MRPALDLRRQGFTVQCLPRELSALYFRLAVQEAWPSTQTVSPINDSPVGSYNAHLQPRHDTLIRLPTNKNIYDLARALDTFCPRPIIGFLVQNFMDHIYPITPVVHKPTFLANLNDHRQLHDPTFFSVLISVLGVTVCTLPGMIQSCKDIDSNFTHASRKDMLETGERLMLYIRSSDYYDVLSVDKWACAYLHTVANGHLYLLPRAVMHHAEAAAMAKGLKLHVADAYKGLNQIEQQLRKKALWLHFTSERYVAPIYYARICSR